MTAFHSHAIENFAGAVQDFMAALLRDEGERLDLDLAIAVELQDPAHVDRLHVVQVEALDADIGDLVGWTASSLEPIEHPVPTEELVAAVRRYRAGKLAE